METILAFRTTARGTWREMFAGMTAFAREAGWCLQLVDARAKPPDFGELLAFWKPRGAIVDASGDSGASCCADVAGLPAVLINPDDEAGGHATTVGNDSREIARLAMGELLRLSPASLLFVEWYSRRDWCAERRAAAEKIARLHGMRLNAVVPEPGDAAAPRRLVARIAASLKALPLPCGVFAACDSVGAPALAAAARLELDVPGDVAVVSVDDDPEVCENCTPTLTSVRPDYRRLGFAAASLLKTCLDGAAVPVRTTVPLSGLVRRASTVANARRDAKVAEALEMIRLHACDGLKTSRVVALFGTSLHTAEDRFKEATGHTIGQEILERRLSAACDHLREGRSSVAAIAEFCGWNGEYAFRKAFIAHFGVSPKRWRALNGATGA